MIILKQSTAVDVLIGPFVDKTDGVTAETGESPSVKLSKNGQTLAAKNDVTTPLHDADGYYNCELDTTDTNTVGGMVLTVAASANAAPVRHEFQVVEEAVYDAMYGASAVGPATATAMSTAQSDLDTLTGTDGVTLATSQPNYAPATASALATVDANVDAILVDTGTTLETHLTDIKGATFSGATDSLEAIRNRGDSAWITATGFATSAALATVDSNVDAILVDTAEIGAAGAGLTAVPWNASWDAEVQSECADALTAFDPATATALATVDANVDTMVLGIITGSAATGTLSTTQATSDLTGYADDQLIGRIITVTSGAAEGESSDITDYANTSGLLTFTAMTVAMGNGDTFKIT